VRGGRKGGREGGSEGRKSVITTRGGDGEGGRERWVGREGSQNRTFLHFVEDDHCMALTPL